jgi:DNA-binding SARP family transcriptional activator/Tfp pilus assembly protein PilF
MSLKIKLLGTLQITNDDSTPSDIMKWSKGSALLAYLLVTGQAQSREAVADLLWEASSTSQSLQNLRKLLSRMRKWVPDLVVTRKQVTYTTEASDLFSLSMALAAADIEAIDEALHLYEGDLLDGFYLNDAPRFNDWLLLAREQLRQQVVAAYRQVCAFYLEQKMWPNGIDATQRWLLLDSLDEEVIRQLMQMLAAAGQVKAALQQYALSKQALWSELGIDPEPATEALAQKLARLQINSTHWNLIENTQLELPTRDESAEPGLLPTLSMVPYKRNSDFTGRKKSLLYLAEQLLPWPDSGNSFTRVLAITGMGGLGKTQLAVEFCYRYGRYFPGGVFWMSFADAENINAEVAAVGSQRGLGLYQEADQLTLADRVGRVKRAWQEPIPRLLIFDNCEDEALLSAWQPVTGGCRVLLTSRRGYWSAGLGITQLALNVLPVTESIILLQQLHPQLNKTAAKAIAAEVGHLPLALHLAGSFLRRYRQINPDRYLAQLRDQGGLQHPSLQGRGTQHSPTAHELHVARTFSINMAQFDSNEEVDQIAQRLLARAACFDPGEPILRTLLLATVIRNHEDLMAELLAEDGLRRLIALGFLAQQGQEYVIMHRLLVAFTQQTVAALDNAQADVEKILIETLNKQEAGFWELATLPFASGHLHHAMTDALARNSSQAAQLVTLWGRHLRDMSMFAEAEQFFRQALTIQEQTVGHNHLDTAESFWLLANLNIRMGNSQAAQAYCEQSLAIVEALPQYHGLQLARRLHQLGTIHMAQSWFEQGEAYYLRALTIWEQLHGPDHVETIKHTLNLGVLYRRKGECEQARLIFERVLDAVEASVGPRHQFTAIVLNNLGETYFHLGDHEQALILNKRALAIYEEAVGHNHFTTAYSLNRVGWMLMMRGELEEALPFLERALEIRQRVKGSQRSTANTLQHLGTLYLKRGELATAKTYLDQALAIRQQAVRPEHEELAFSYLSLGEWCLAATKKQEACSYFERAWAILQKTVSPRHYAYGLVQEYLELLT